MHFSLLMVFQELCHMELRSIMDTYKFGVLYVKGDKTEDEYYGQLHEDGSADYYEFLKFLGEEIPLLGWDKYRGGLDVKSTVTIVATFTVQIIAQDFALYIGSSTSTKLCSTSVLCSHLKRRTSNEFVNINFYGLILED